MINELKGVTLLFITHRLDVTQQSDEVLVLHEGRLVDRGSPEELRSRPGIYPGAMGRATNTSYGEKLLTKQF